MTSLNENVHIIYVVSGILITLSLSKVMDLLMDTVRKVGEEEGSVKDE